MARWTCPTSARSDRPGADPCRTLTISGADAPGRDWSAQHAVTAVLASYRGFDTLGEAAVVFAAGIGVLLLISGLRRRRRDEDLPEPDHDRRGPA